MISEHWCLVMKHAHMTQSFVDSLTDSEGMYTAPIASALVNYLRRRRLCFWFGLFVCLSVGLLANLWTDFDEIFWRVGLKDQVIQFWWRSGSRFGSGSPKSEIRILRIGGGLCSMSIAFLFIIKVNRFFSCHFYAMCVCIQYSCRFLMSLLLLTEETAFVGTFCWGMPVHCRV